jgi:hypothetical protein
VRESELKDHDVRALYRSGGPYSRSPTKDISPIAGLHKRAIGTALLTIQGRKAAASTACGLAPLITSHSMKAISPIMAG